MDRVGDELGIAGQTNYLCIHVVTDFPSGPFITRHIN